MTLSSQVVNLMAFAKNKKRSKSHLHDQFKTNISNLILSFLLVTKNQQQVSFLKFLLEQITLLFTSKHQRQYSYELLMMAYIIFFKSSKSLQTYWQKCFRLICVAVVFIIPHSSTVYITYTIALQKQKLSYIHFIFLFNPYCEYKPMRQ